MEGMRQYGPDSRSEMMMMMDSIILMLHIFASTFHDCNHVHNFFHFSPGSSTCQASFVHNNRWKSPNFLLAL